MPRLQQRSFDEPDEIRPLAAAHARIVHLDETTVGLATWQPGWRWSTHLGPSVGTPSCPIRHLGYAVAGRLHVATDDGQEMIIRGGSVYEIPSGHDAWVLGDTPFVTIEWTSSDVVGAAMAGGRRVLATVMFTDIVDSTRLLAAMGDDAWKARLREHNRVCREVLNRFHGREVDTTGDGFLIVFDSASRAVECGLAMADAVSRVDLQIRVGLHTGEILFVGDQVRGITVHAAARVMSRAAPGEVVVSGSTRDLVEGSDLRFESVGLHEMKGVSGARELFRTVPATT